jgi:MYXO-CTERM domain-containing protein
MRPIVDVANDATGHHLVTAIGPNGVDDTLVLSDDGGASWTLGARIPSFFTETVEMAPSDPSRLYIAGFIRGGIPVLLRSDDGGMTTREVARDMAFAGGQSAFISGVDPTNPDVVYLRSSIGLGTLLLRSDDGGRSFREITRTDDQMVGFALSDDGSTVWVASNSRAEGIRRSVRGGPFTRVAATVTARCLRQHAGVLYVCADEAVDGFLLGSSIDGGDRIDALMSGRLLTGPSPTCNASTQVGMVCGPLWPTQRMPLTAIDAGPPPVLVPRDAAVIDLGARTDTAIDAVSDVASEGVRDVVSEAVSDVPDDLAGDGASDVMSEAASDVAFDAASDGARDVMGDAVLDTSAVADVPGDTTRDAAVIEERATTPPSGCGCHARGDGEGGGWWALALAAVGLRRRRRGRDDHRSR